MDSKHRIAKYTPPNYHDKENLPVQSLAQKVALFVREFFISNYKSTLSSRHRVAVNFLRLAVAAFISSFLFQYFLKNMILSTGVSGVGLLIDNLINSRVNFSTTRVGTFEANSILYVLFIVLNIPFFIYAVVVKINKKFIFNTVIFLLIMLLWGMFLPWQSAGGNIFSWITALRTNVGSDINHNLQFPSDQRFNFVWQLLLLAVFAGMLKSVALFIIYGSSSTSGGTDFVGFNWAIHKKQNFALVIGVFNTIVVMGVLILSYMFNTAYNYHAHEGLLSFLTSFKTIATFIYIVVFSIIIKIIYPINQKLYVAIVTRKPLAQFYHYFIHSNLTNYSHSFTVINSPGLLHINRRHQNTLITISTLFEFDALKNHIRKLDKRAFVYIIKVNKILGKYREVLF